MIENVIWQKTIFHKKDFRLPCDTFMGGFGPYCILLIDMHKTSTPSYKNKVILMHMKQYIHSYSSILHFNQSSIFQNAKRYREPSNVSQTIRIPTLVNSSNIHTSYHINIYCASSNTFTNSNLTKYKIPIDFSLDISTIP